MHARNNLNNNIQIGILNSNDKKAEVKQYRDIENILALHVNDTLPSYISTDITQCTFTQGRKHMAVRKYILSRYISTSDEALIQIQHSV